MALLQLDLASLNDLDDGRVAVAFMHELKRAVSDCIDRPGDKNARTVSLELKITPVVDADSGQCEEAHGEFQIKSKVPQRKSKTYSFGIRKGGMLAFNSNSPEQVDQRTIFDGKEST